MKKYFAFLTLILVMLPALLIAKSPITKRPRDFIDIQSVIPDVAMDMRYFGPHNFIGERIDGYEAPKCFLTEEAAEALSRVQKELRAYSMSLKIYDCFRPQRAVDHFVRWAKDIKDTRMKAEFYPDVDKKVLFSDGYIASKSGHSRGSTVDLTIVPVPAPRQADYVQGQPLKDCRLPVNNRFKDNSIDMGSGFDCFDPLSHTANAKIGEAQKRNRLLLKSIMEKNGFTNYENEWWHYTLRDESFPKRYFDFPIENSHVPQMPQ